MEATIERLNVPADSATIGTMSQDEPVTAKQAAERLDLDESYIRRLCQLGRIPGAVKFAGVWKIPESSLAGISRTSKAGRPRKGKSGRST